MKRRPKDSPVAGDSTPPAIGDTKTRPIYKLGLAFITGAALAGVLIAVALSATNEPSDDGVRPSKPTASTRAEQQRVHDLVVEHDCWSGKAPADMEDQIPGGAVMSTHGYVHYTEYPPEIGIALDRVFKGKHRAVVKVFAFCRGGDLR